MSRERRRLRKDPKKSLSLHLRLILSPETSCNNKKKTANLRKRKNLTSRIPALLDSNVQFSTSTTTNYKAYKETGVSFKGKNKLTETVSENDQMAELLDKSFKTTILEMF